MYTFINIHSCIHECHIHMSESNETLLQLHYLCTQVRLESAAENLILTVYG